VKVKKNVKKRKNVTRIKNVKNVFYIYGLYECSHPWLLSDVCFRSLVLTQQSLSKHQVNPQHWVL